MDTLYKALTKKFSETHQVNIGEHYQDFKDLADYVNVQFSRKDPSPSYDEFQKEVLKQSWEYFEKKFVSKIDSTRALDFVDSYDTHRQSQTHALKGLYQNTGYGQERQEMQSLVIDSYHSSPVFPGTGGNTITFSINLVEPLVIDKLSNVYLDNISTLGINSNTIVKDMCMLLKIDQFNINTKGTGSTTNHLNDKILIPNSRSSSSSVMTTHKGNKFNYVAQINPQKITKISGSITGVEYQVGTFVQTVTTSAGAADLGGTFTLSFGGQTTTALSKDATAASVTIALNALSTIDDASVSSSAANNGFVYLITLKVGVTGTVTDILTVEGALLTGTTNSITVSAPVYSALVSTAPAKIFNACGRFILEFLIVAGEKMSWK